MERIQMWVDMEALNKAILAAPLTASTAFPIYDAIGFSLSEPHEIPSHQEPIQEPTLNREGPYSGST